MGSVICKLLLLICDNAPKCIPTYVKKKKKKKKPQKKQAGTNHVTFFHKQTWNGAGTPTEERRSKLFVKMA